MLTRVIWHGPWLGMRRELAFLVMDELHVYRGRQGADVAMPLRRGRHS